ncbi:MAG: YggS family pyridoxal phosphate-dependent enzyme [Flavobacteriales bacterium]|jgi:pyridoxal phosphate enzyme (YggS family)|nr:YggS family pyridoxal phosphate-dependent enzyme [Flavobacteriales bacterium]MCB0757067.1 YggS family pyridoxal phosphate-dependent enzyme [Flavobacteriales bacterium]
MDKAALAARYARVKENLPAHVLLIAVSKTRTVEEIQALHNLGHRAFGENYPQELRDKYPLLPDDIQWHFIGHLQSNKVKYIIPFVHLVHGVDRESLLNELDKRATTAGRSIGVLLQVHIAEEDTKHGFSPAELRALIQRGDLTTRWPSLRFRGLMGMATNTDDLVMVRREFDGLAALRDELRQSGAVDMDLFTELSMGMSGDLEEAVAAGSTMVRIGTAIFGERA